MEFVRELAYFVFVVGYDDLLQDIVDLIDLPLFFNIFDGFLFASAHAL